MRLTRWDARVFGRAALVSSLVLALTLLVTAATDEGGVAWAERTVRTFPMSPACAAVGAWVALAAVRARGESLALQALGRSNAELAVAAIAGAAFVAFAAALAILAAPAIHLGAFFPRAARASAWLWQDGAFVDHVQGLRVGPSGELVRVPVDATAVMATIPRYGRVAAAMATAGTGLALPMLLAHALFVGTQGGDPTRPTRRHRCARVVAILAAGAALTSSVVIFQAAAAGRMPSLVGVLPGLALLAFAATRYLALPW